MFDDDSDNIILDQFDQTRRDVVSIMGQHHLLAGLWSPNATTLPAFSTVLPPRIVFFKINGGGSSADGLTTAREVAGISMRKQCG